jgi:hypothetical protein
MRDYEKYFELRRKVGLGKQDPSSQVRKAIWHRRAASHVPLSVDISQAQRLDSMSDECGGACRRVDNGSNCFQPNEHHSRLQSVLGDF